MGSQHPRCEITNRSDGLCSEKGTVHLELIAYFSKYCRLFLLRRDLRDGAQASFREKADLLIRQIQQRVKDCRSELQQVERLGDSRSGHAKMFGQICPGGTSALVEKTFENECLFHRISDRYDWFVADCSWLGVRGFNGRYEKLALVQSRKVNPERQIEEVRKSFGRGEPPVIYEL